MVLLAVTVMLMLVVLVLPGQLLSSSPFPALLAYSCPWLEDVHFLLLLRSEVLLAFMGLAGVVVRVENTCVHNFLVLNPAL